MSFFKINNFDYSIKLIQYKKNSHAFRLLFLIYYKFLTTPRGISAKPRRDLYFDTMSVISTEIHHSEQEYEKKKKNQSVRPLARP